MQIQMQAFGKKSGSLRKMITEDLVAHQHDILYVQKFKKKERAPGWAKVLGHGLSGALNLKWDPNSRMLTVRAIAKRANTPHELLGVFLAYLIERYGKKLVNINIQLR